LPRGGYPANEAYYPAIDAANAGDLASATQAFGEEIKIHLDNAAAYFNRGVALEAEGQHEQAISDYGQALKIISGRPEVSFSMKGAYLIDGQPDNFFILYARAGAYSTMGQVDLAMADYTRAIDIKPDFADALV
jgi:tetratricopeptide (TPR) repeat protein